MSTVALAPAFQPRVPSSSQRAKRSIPTCASSTPERARVLQKLLGRVNVNAQPGGWGAFGQNLIHGLAISQAHPWAAPVDIEAIRPKLERAALQVVDPGVAYPDYYQRLFHGTQNLTWDAAAHQLAGMQLLGNHNAALASAVDFVQRTYPDVCADPRLIVDVGCGTGNSSRIWARQFNEAIVKAIDLSPTMLAWASVHQQPEDDRIQWTHGNGEHLPCHAGSADIIAASFYAHEQPRSAMRHAVEQALDALRPGGVMMILDNGQAYPQGWMKNLPASVKNWSSNALLFEPYGADFIDTDFPELLRSVGFVDIAIDTSDPARLTVTGRKPLP